MQDALVIPIVAAAALYLLRRVWQRLAAGGSATCGSCSHCPSSGSTKSPALVNISPTITRPALQKHLDSAN
jgi:hypothetical protein